MKIFKSPSGIQFKWSRNSSRAPWASQLPARWVRAGNMEPWFEKVDQVAIGGSIEVPRYYHPRHGWEMIKITRIA